MKGNTWVLLAVAGTVVAQQKHETIVTLCDNVTEVVIPGLKPGQKLDSRRAFQVADTFMTEWKRQNPGSNWIMAQTDTGAGNGAASAAGSGCKASRGLLGLLGA